MPTAVLDNSGIRTVAKEQYQAKVHKGEKGVFTLVETLEKLGPKNNDYTILSVTEGRQDKLLRQLKIVPDAHVCYLNEQGRKAVRLPFHPSIEPSISQAEDLLLRAEEVNQKPVVENPSLLDIPFRVFRFSPSYTINPDKPQDALLYLQDHVLAIVASGSTTEMICISFQGMLKLHHSLTSRMHLHSTPTLWEILREDVLCNKPGEVNPNNKQIPVTRVALDGSDAQIFDDLLTQSNVFALQNQKYEFAVIPQNDADWFDDLAYAHREPLVREGEISGWNLLKDEIRKSTSV